MQGIECTKSDFLKNITLYFISYILGRIHFDGNASS